MSYKDCIFYKSIMKGSDIVICPGKHSFLCKDCSIWHAKQLNETNKAAEPQNKPNNGNKEVLPNVLKDLKDRVQMGLQKYGSVLKTNNGRDSLLDLYQEILDAAMYIKQKLMEKENEMDFDEYQRRAQETAVYPDKGKNLFYPCLGLAGEAGEVAEKYKKIIRNKDGIISDYDREEIAKELGDVLWYLADIAFEIGFSLNTVAQMNIEKLSSRAKRGVIKSEGDNR